MIYRQTPDGKRWPAAKQGGYFVLGDPKHGKNKHQPENEVKVRTEEEAIKLLRDGFSIRVETATRPSLVRKNLFVDGEPIGA